MNKANLSKYLSIRLAITLVIAFILGIAASAALYLFEEQSQYVKVTCADFTSSQYKEVVMLYNEGDVALDRNNDGIPCNELYETIMKKTK